MPIRSRAWVCCLLLLGTSHALGQDGENPFILSAGDDAQNVRDAGNAFVQQLAASGEHQRALAEAQKISFEAKAEFERALLENALQREQLRRERYQTVAQREATRYQREQAAFEAEQTKRDQRLEGKQRQFQRQGDQLKDLPVAPAEFPSGRHHNEILERIYLEGLTDASSTTNTDLLPSRTLASLRVHEPIDSGKVKLAFDAEGKPSPALFLPRDLRVQLPNDLLAGYESARGEALAALARGGPVTDAQYLGATKALFELSTAFQAKRRGFVSNSDERYKTLVQWNEFLKEQRVQLERVGLAVPLPEAFKGSSVVDLVRYMQRHGLRFAPADPGGEAAYESLYWQLRKHLVAAAKAGD